MQRRPLLDWVELLDLMHQFLQVLLRVGLDGFDFLNAVDNANFS